MKISRIFEIGIQIFGLLASIYLIILFFGPISKSYLNSPRAVGGDYFNALAYIIQLHKYTPLPPQGWLSFWNLGVPVIGGYPILTFYLMKPLLAVASPADALQLFGIATQWAFLLFSLLLFWDITKSAIATLTLTLIVLYTKASLFQLFSEALYTAAASQWLLPLTLIFAYRYINKWNIKYFILAGLTSGISVLLHPAMGILTVVLPSMILLITGIYFRKMSNSQKIFQLFMYLLIIIGIGASSLYGMLGQIIWGGGSGACTDKACWGIYPEHFNLWFIKEVPIIIAVLFILSILAILIKKLSFVNLFSSLFSFMLLLLYPVLAYFHKIDTLTSAIYPRRIFWAINVLLLVVAAQSYKYITDALGKRLSFLVSALFLSIVALLWIISPFTFNFKYDQHFGLPGTMPGFIDESIVPKYQKKAITSVVPEWVYKKGQSETDYRFHTLNNQVNVWWNTVFPMPAVNGYSNTPFGKPAMWLYFLQVATGEVVNHKDKELVRNQTLFLLDHYAIDLYEDSGRSSNKGTLGYDPGILNDTRIIKNTGTIGVLNFYEINKELISPIISPTNTVPLMHVGNDSGYETLIRSLSLTGLDSKVIIPVKGVKRINNLNSKELENFPSLFLYDFEVNSWDKIEDKIKKGGTVYIELRSTNYKNPSSLPNFFPFKKFSEKEVQGKLNLQTGSNSPITNGIHLSEFASFEYHNGSWKLYTSSTEDLRPNAEILLKLDDNTIVLSKMRYGDGEVIVSGLNLPYHILEKQNIEEVKLLKNVITSLIEKHTSSIAPSYKIERVDPATIHINGKDFSGVYFKENYHSGWKAQVNNVSTPIYEAGLSFMYIPIPRNLKGQDVKISINFMGNLTTWGVFTLTVGTLSLVLMYLLLPRKINPIVILKNRLFSKIKYKYRRLKNWWSREGN